MVIKAFIYHKRAEKYSDCQDCFGISSQNNRIAISDGMSQSIFPQWWAKILVDDYLENGHIPQDIIPLQEKWQGMLIDEIQRRAEESITNPKRDPWRLKNLLAEKSGAGATLCGLTLDGNEWTCECLGDSCVITINHDYTLNIYTSQVGEFGNHPDYFDSFRIGRGEPIRKNINRDVKCILMVTDPFAELFQINENNEEFIKSRYEELLSLTNHESYSELVEKWRDEFGMHNDDSTLVLITDCVDRKFEIAYADCLDQLCQDERNLLEDRSLTSSKLSSINHNEELKIVPSQEQSKHAAIESFKSSFENLMPYYTGKKSSGKITDWIKLILKPLIDTQTKS